MGRLQSHRDSTSPEPATPLASRPPAVAALPAPPPATSPVLPAASDAAADADRPFAAVERESDALFAEVGRLEGHQDSTSPEQATPPGSPPPAVAALPAPPPATSPVLPAASEAAAEPDRPAAAVERESDALFAEVGRLEGHQDSTSPEQATPPGSPPLAVAALPAPALASLPASPPATSPVLPLASKAPADADRPVAAVELERDAAAAEVDRLQSHRDSTSPEPATPLASRPPAVAALPAPPPATSPVLPAASEAAADADRPVAAVERESDALFAEVGRLEGHQDSTSPEQATPPGSPPPAVAALPAPPPATSPVLPAASEAAAEPDRPAAAVERESDALFAEVGRLEGHQDSTSPEQAAPRASPPPAVAALPAPALASLPASPPATSPVLPLASKAPADADRPVAAVELERDAMAAEVDRLQCHRDSTSPEPATPQASRPPAVAALPAPPPATSPVQPGPPRKRRRMPIAPSRGVVERESDAAVRGSGPARRSPGLRPLLSRPHPRGRRRRPSPLCPLRRPQLRPSCRPPRKRRRSPIAPPRRSSAKATRCSRKWAGSKVTRTSTSPEQAAPRASPPLAVAALPAPALASLPASPPATSPVLPLASKAPADADRPVAAVELERDAMAAVVDSGSKVSFGISTFPEARPPPGVALPPAVAVSPAPPPTSSPVAPPATSPVPPLASEAAADADRRIAAVERKMDAMAAEVGRLEGHQDSTSPEQATPPASPPPAVAVSPVAPPTSSPVAPLASSPVLPLASEAAADADRRIAAVERKMDAMAAELGRLAGHQDSTSPEQAAPRASPPAVAVSPVAREDARPAPPVVHAGVADLTSDEACRRDGDRLARLRASPSGEETGNVSQDELGCEGLAAAASASDGEVWAWSRPCRPRRMARMAPLLTRG